MEIDIDDIEDDSAVQDATEYDGGIREGEAVDDLALAARFAVPEGEIGVPMDALPVLRAAVMPSAPAAVNGDSSDSDSESSDDDVAEAPVNEDASVAAPDEADSELESQPAQAGGTGKKKVVVAVEDEDEDVGDAPPVRTKNEVPLWQLPIAPLPSFTVDSQAKQLLQAAGAILHVHEGIGWDFDPLLAIEGGGGASKGRSKGKGKRKNGSSNSTQNNAASTADGLPVGGRGGPAVVRDELVTYTLVVQAALQPGQRPLDEKSLLCLPDGRVVGHVEDVFGPVKLPLYLLRVRARTGITKDELERHGVEYLSSSAPPGQGAASSSLDLLMAGYASEDEDEDEGRTEAQQGAATAVSALQSQQTQVVGASTASGPAETLVRTLDLQPGAVLCSLPTHARWIIPEQLLANPWLRGSDASNVYDEEIAPEEQEYSDDEAEQQARARNKALRRRTDRAGGAGEGQDEADAEDEVEPDGALLDAPHAFRRTRGGGRGGKGRTVAARTASSGMDAGVGTAIGSGPPSAPSGAHAWPPGMPYPYPPPPPYAFAYPPQQGQASAQPSSAAGQPFPPYPYPYPYPYPGMAAPAPAVGAHGASGAMQAQMAAMAALQSQLMSAHSSGSAHQG